MNSEKLYDTRPIYKNQFSLYTINKHSQTEIRKIICSSNKKNRILKKKFNQESSRLYTENYKTSMKKSKEDLNK